MAGNSYIVCALTVATMCVAVASGSGKIPNKQTNKPHTQTHTCTRHSRRTHTRPTAPVVNTTYGPVTGTVQGSTTVFHAIPFAAPPVGDLRFRPPQPPTPWTEPVDGTTPAPSCMQIPILSSKTKGYRTVARWQALPPSHPNTLPHTLA